MHETTHREYLLWVAYFEDQWNCPTKTDWYLAQIAREVACVLEGSDGRKQKTVKSYLMNFRFSKSNDQKDSLDPSSNWKQSKSIWGAVLSQAKKMTKRSSKNGKRS